MDEDLSEFVSAMNKIEEATAELQEAIRNSTGVQRMAARIYLGRPSVTSRLFKLNSVLIDFL